MQLRPTDVTQTLLSSVSIILLSPSLCPGKLGAAYRRVVLSRDSGLVLCCVVLCGRAGCVEWW